MSDGRFGSFEPSEKPKKKYRVDYNRLITVIMIAVILVLLLVIFIDSGKEPENNTPIINADVPNNNFYVSTQAPRATVSPEELRPVPESENLLPVFYRANTTSKRVAITIENLSDSDNITTLLGLLATFDAKVTFFPTGTELESTVNVWPKVVLAGHQIENRTYSNKRLSIIMDEDKTDEFRLQTELVRMIIGDEYQPHFLRTDYLEDNTDEFLHSYLIGNGYYGIARFEINNPESIHQVEPGAILNFPLTDSGLSKLRVALPVLVENGYSIVTLNELFAYPDNLEFSAETAG